MCSWICWGLCDTGTDSCACGQNQRCVDGGTCVCEAGYTGPDCLAETEIDDCAGINCHYGQCVKGTNAFSCNCNFGFTGVIQKYNTSLLKTRTIPLFDHTSCGRSQCSRIIAVVIVTIVCARKRTFVNPYHRILSPTASRLHAAAVYRVKSVDTSAMNHVYDYPDQVYQRNETNLTIGLYKFHSHLCGCTKYPL